MAFATRVRGQITCMSKKQLDKNGREAPPTCAMCDVMEMMLGAGRRSFSVSDDMHTTCPRCGIRFGGTHAGGPVPVPEDQRGMCIDCCYKYLPQTFTKRREINYD